MSDVKSIQERNQALARQINEEALRDPQSPYAGKFVGITDGQVVVIADDLQELGRRMEELGVEPAHSYWVEASHNYDEIVEIWRVS